MTTLERMVTVLRTAAALLIFTPALLRAAVPGDEVKALPGWSGSLPTRQYSGYISVDDKNGRYLHYWFVESAQDPSTDPVVMWLNGGPGCSSLDGYFYEQGPLHFGDNWENETIPTLVANPYAWNRIANMLFVEAPAGVGFSYSKTASDYNTNDNKTADDNFAFLLNWFKAYPEYARNDFYLSGESYAGIYVPTLAWNIMTKENSINMKGFMVGNGCYGNQVGVCSRFRYKYEIEFLHGHGLYSEEMYSNLSAACAGSEPSAKCQELYQKMQEVVGRVNIYDIYEPCIISGAAKEPRLRVKTEQRGTGRQLQFGLAECIDGAAAYKYLNLPEVRNAIHVLPSSAIGEWHICTGKIKYTGNVGSLIPAYPRLINKYRTLIYNGDVDACVPYVDNEEWTSSLGYHITENWRAWYVDNQVAGYVTRYNENDFTFITVKGSGHMVPQFRPKQAFAMFERYLNNKPF